MMPGWFSDHFQNMRRYSHLSCIGVVVGSQRNGQGQGDARAGHEARPTSQPTPTWS